MGRRTLLQYFVSVTEDLTITVTLITLLLTLAKRLWAKQPYAVVKGGVVAGNVLSAVFAAVKSTTNLIDTNRWNQYFFYFTICISVLLIAVLILSLAKGRQEGPLALSGAVLSALLIVFLLLYELPNVLSNPKNFYTAGNGVLSVEFLVRLVGWLGALVLMLLYARFLGKCASNIKKPGIVLTVLSFGLIVNSVRDFGTILGQWVTHARWLKWPIVYNRSDYPWVFPFVRFTANNTLLFTLIIAGLAVAIALILFLQNLHISGDDANPAQKRKLRAHCRHNRRAAVMASLLFAVSILNLTVGYAAVHKKVELSAPETYTIQGNDILIAVEDVNDGSLHRFEYKTANGVQVRWIIIQKPNSASFGIGLDACDVCGTAGYYQRGDQVVCKQCDVMMNINTIGFKGGCNPIPLAYRIESGNIVFSLDDIQAAETKFK